MSKKADMAAALECRQPAGTVPIWELEFHAWDQVFSRHVILGTEFAALSAGEQEQALYTNAKILLSVAEHLHFAALTVPGSYWEIAPGAPATYWLPDTARYRQVEVLQRIGTNDLMLVAGTGGVMSMPSADKYVEFAYKIYDAPQEIERMAQQRLEAGLEKARQFRDLGIEAMFTASDIADNHGPYFNAAQMERFILPYLRKWAAEVKAMGCYTILHTDGDLNLCLEGIADSGIHALQAIDPVAGMEMRKAATACVCAATWTVGCSSPGHQRKYTQRRATCCSTAKRGAASCLVPLTPCSKRCRSRTIAP
jgi:uroporphyrinogen decarboxylase